jgi:hypothetical protein
MATVAEDDRLSVLGIIKEVFEDPIQAIIFARLAVHSLLIYWAEIFH